MNKKTLYLLGLVTLLLFPIPTFLGLYWMEDMSPATIFEFDRLTFGNVGLGLLLGVLYAIVALGFMQAEVFQNMPTRVEQLVRNMQLNVLDCVFLSLCAGVGEELLFRSGVQFYLGPWITSFIFVAIHGYLNPMNWRMSLYGLIVLPFILLISFALPVWGLWFCISAHFSYDLVLFLVMTFEED